MRPLAERRQALERGPLAGRSRGRDFHQQPAALAAARHADARARSVRHLEALLAGATDDAERRDLRARLADVAAPRSGCCK